MQSQDELIGTVALGRYRVLSQLGQGGMGNVYLAVHEAIQKKIALKVLRLEYSIKPELVTRFQQEAISASRIKHPGVLDVFDFGRLDNGCFFIAMELLEGQDLADELEKRHIVAPDRAVRIAIQLCRALAAAHAQGVVHRDLKPENVFLHLSPDGDEVVKIVDFGIAQLRTNEQLAQQSERRRLTRTGMIFGTPEYMSPEQALGSPVDLRSDIYAAGVMLYEMLTGAVPFTGDSFFGVLNAHTNQALPPMRALYPALSISHELEAAVSRALAKRPDDRFQSMKEFAAALGATAEGSSMRALPPAGPVPAVDPRAFRSRARDTEPQFSERPTAPGPAPASLRPAPERRSPVAKLALALLGLGVVVAAGWLVMRSQLVPPAAEPSAAASVVASAPPPAAAPPATPSAEPARTVELRITTEPAGAVLFRDGFQVCDTTPCELEVAADSRVELEAKKGLLRGASKVLAQRDQSVRIALSGPSAAPRPREPAGECWTTTETPEGLKVPKRIPCR